MDDKIFYSELEKKVFAINPKVTQFEWCPQIGGKFVSFIFRIGADRFGGTVSCIVEKNKLVSIDEDELNQFLLSVSNY